MSTMFTAWRQFPYPDCSLVQIYAITPPLNSNVYHKHDGLLGAVASPSESSDHLIPAFLHVCVCLDPFPCNPSQAKFLEVCKALTMQNYGIYKNRTKMNAAVSAGPPAAKKAVPTLQSRGRTLASVAAGKHWSHTCPRMGKYHLSKKSIVEQETGLRPSSSLQSFKSFGAHQLAFEVCEFSKFCLERKNTEEIDASEALLSKSNTQSCNYDEGKRKC